MHIVAVYGLGDGLVAMAARGLHHFAIKPGDFNGVRITSGGEIEGMKEAIVGFDRVFADDVVRRVTVIAGGGGVMAGLDPSVILRVHDVAIGAGAGIAGKIGVTLGVDKRVSADSDSQTYKNGQDYFETYRSHA
jgi:hypothetical protein